MTPQNMASLHAACFTMPRPWSAHEFAEMLSSPMVFTLTAPDALLLARVVADEAELLTLAVAPAARRNGLGRQLVQQFLAEAQRRGAESAFLEVAASNQPAQALYLAAGFTQAGKRRGYYHMPDGTSDDALILIFAFPQEV
ncbi:GNAT family N-acetyltransferase [Fuscibacter oryzae]|uniref:GNAT family N-acetyltransferase n=1 Tax=Fuscibacter oryzae TaxID=2803939 RepID=A0A8J7MLE0_9RHOB|nr:GNAT family N-acetyltransferase [Fuscibacter oryzae]MBL4926910.1 GNAT family N-acetyltransferase [Fuscibacter oryzae]